MNAESWAVQTIEQKTSELTAAIYAALLGESSWQGFLDELTGGTPGSLSTLFFHNFTAGTGGVAYVAGAEGRQDALADYERYYSNINPWMRRVAATPLGRGVIGEEIISRNDFNRSEYYSDYVRKNGLETGIGLTLFKSQSFYFLLSMLTDDVDTDRNLARAEVLTRIAPHLQRVFRYYRSEEFHADVLDAGKGIGMATGLAFILVNEDLKVIKASPAAEQALASGRVAGLDPSGRIRLADPGTQAVLRALLLRRKAPGETEVFSIRDASVQIIRIGRSPAAEFFAGPVAAILIGEDSNQARLDRLAARYRLSPGEARVCAGILKGLNLSEIADQAAVTRETVRSQLKSVFSKTGTSSQMDIIRLVAGLSLKP